MNSERLKNRAENLEYFRTLDYFSQQYFSPKLKVTSDEHLLGGYFSENLESFYFYSPLSADFLALVDVYIELLLKKKGEVFISLAEAENYLRDKNHEKAIGADFNWDLAESLVHKLGWRMKSKLWQKGYEVCHCYGHFQANLMSLIQTQSIKTLADLQKSLSIGDKCGKCLTPSMEQNRPCDIGTLFVLAPVADPSALAGLWKDLDYYMGVETPFQLFESLPWIEQLKILEEWVKKTYKGIFAKSTADLEILEWNGTFIDYQIKQKSEVNLNQFSSYKKFFEGSLRKLGLNSLKLRLFQDKGSGPVLLEL
jgi:bacterioferritin-associated ferredoxin